MRDPGEQHAAVTGEPAASKRCTAGSGRGPLEKEPHSGNLASGLPVLRHGHVRGRLVELRLVYDLEKAVTVEVSDAGDHRPPSTAPRPADVGLAESGRGLALVEAFADAWGVRDRVVGKTVWARLLVDPNTTGRV